MCLLVLAAAGICQAPANPVNGRVDWSGDAGRTLALYSCNVGYSLVGSQSSICVDGIWSPSSPPTCVGSGEFRLLQSTSTRSVSKIL